MKHYCRIAKSKEESKLGHQSRRNFVELLEADIVRDTAKLMHQAAQPINDQGLGWHQYKF